MKMDILLEAAKAREDASEQLQKLRERQMELAQKCDMAPAVKIHMSRIGCPVDEAEFHGYDHTLRLVRGDATLSINMIAYFYHSKGKTPHQISKLVAEACEIAQKAFDGSEWRGYRSADFRPTFA